MTNLVHHLHSVLVLAGLGQARRKFKKYRQIVSSDNAIAVRIYLHTLVGEKTREYQEQTLSLQLSPFTCKGGEYTGSALLCSWEKCAMENVFSS